MRGCIAPLSAGVMPREAMSPSVETPQGQMIKAGLLAPNVAVVVDLIFVTTTASLLAKLLKEVLHLAVDDMTRTIVALLFLPALGIYLMRRRLFRTRTPGEWALGLRGFRYSELPGYSGSGFLWCREILVASEYTRRTLAVAAILAVLALPTLG